MKKIVKKTPPKMPIQTKKNILNTINRETALITPKTLSQKILETLVSYLKGRFLLMVLTGVIFFTILTLLNVKYALLLAIFTAVASTVPFFGMTLAGLFATVITIFDGNTVFSLPDWGEAIVIAVVYIILNQIIDFLITPFLLGKTSDVHPLVLLIAIILGTTTFGIVGTILAVPVVLVGKVILDHCTEKSNLKTIPIVPTRLIQKKKGKRK